jgi:N,N'-diacetylchitobiose transport system substrate-binding protein
MRIRFMAAAVVVAALAVAVSTATGAPGRAAADSITVWLQVDARSGWADAVEAANRAFKAQHPGADVKVEYQEWTTHLTKLDASIAGGNAPDVVEMGNTEMTKYMAAGAFADLTSQKGSFPNASTWLKGLEASATYNGKLYGVPYYAGSRAVIYRKDYFKKAGIATPPKTLDEFLSAGQKLMKTYSSNKNFSAFYFAGRDWYSGLGFVYAYGGKIAKTKGGKWVGSLDSTEAIQGLTKLKQIVLGLSRASKTTDESHPFPTVPFAQGRSASFIGPGWQWGYALDPKVGNPKLAPQMGAFPLPGRKQGEYVPGFLGGSDLAIPVTSKNKQLAADWIKAFTATPQMTAIVKAGNIPNSTNAALLNVAKTNPKLAPFAESAKFSWFVPQSKNWVNVESSNVLQNMLTAIFTNRKTVKQAAVDASRQITEILNESA